MIAHASGLIDTWGFAYAGAVLGPVLVGLSIVRQEIRQRTEPDTATPAWRIPRWWISVAFVCGASFGLGTGRVLENVLAETPDPAAVASSLCHAVTSDDDTTTYLISQAHDDTDHLVVDLDIASLTSAHDRVHAALSRSAEPDELRATVSALVSEIDRNTPDTVIDSCATD